MWSCQAGVIEKNGSAYLEQVQAPGAHLHSAPQVHLSVQEQAGLVAGAHWHFSQVQVVPQEHGLVVLEQLQAIVKVVIVCVVISLSMKMKMKMEMEMEMDEPMIRSGVDSTFIVLTARLLLEVPWKKKANHTPAQCAHSKRISAPPTSRISSNDRVVCAAGCCL